MLGKEHETLHSGPKEIKIVNELDTQNFVICALSETNTQGKGSITTETATESGVEKDTRVF